jgi:hypothetical protein
MGPIWIDYLTGRENITSEVTMKNSTINKAELMRLGHYREHTAMMIIRKAKIIMVERGYPFYSNRRLGDVPLSVVEEIIGCSLGNEEQDHA